MIKIFTIIILLFISVKAKYVDLGIRGKQHEIKEKSFQQLIDEKFNQLDFPKLEAKLIKNIDESLIVKSKIQNCEKNNMRVFDPTMIIKEDVVIPYFNKTLYKKGYKYNPIKENNMAFKKYLFFINADDEKQILLAYKYSNNAEIYVAKGDIKKLKPYGIPALIVRENMEAKAFDIKCLPSIYTQDGLVFKVNEYKLED